MSSSHYIRTIHTSFTAAHPSPWARNPLSTAPIHHHHHHQPLYTSSSPQSKMNAGIPPTAPLHHTLTTLSSSTTSPAPPSGAGGRRRAYAFRVSHSATTSTQQGQKPRFDPFADEPTSPVPSIAHLASLSAPPTPRLAAASLPPSRVHHQQGAQGYAQHHQGRRASQGYQHHQGAQQGFNYAAHGPQAQAYAPQGYPPAPRRSGFPGQRSRSPAPSFVIDSSSPSVHNSDARSVSYGGPTEVWRSSSPSAGARRGYQVYEQEFEFDLGVPVGGNGGLLMEPLTSRRVARVSGPAPRRSPPPAPIARRSPSPPSPSSPSHSPSHSSSSTQHPPHYSQRTSPRTPSPPAPLPAQKSPAQLQAEKHTRAKLVAGILLNRIHVQKKAGGRRVPSPVGGERVYVPSGLRREVSVSA